MTGAPHEPGISEEMVLPEERWRAMEVEHGHRARSLTRAHLERRATGVRHPVEDFLFTYYRTTPGRLQRWHPGPGVILTGGARCERASWRFTAVHGDDICLDLVAYRAARGDTVTFVRELLDATSTRPGRFTCFGLHEWAMVYGLPASDIRHAGWPLRLGARGTDSIVESMSLSCSHFDAFRFFTDAARPRNSLRPTRDSQAMHEQPGCLHAGMDLYKWATKLGPLVPGVLLLDCFQHARAARVLDMRASPYDLTTLGYQPIRIETADGRAEYVAGQRELADSAQQLRARLLQLLDRAHA